MTSKNLFQYTVTTSLIKKKSKKSQPKFDCRRLVS